MDLNLPDQSGESLIAQYQKLRPNIRILIFSATHNMSVIDRCMKLGAQGFVLKRARWDELLLAIDQVALQKIPYIPPELQEYQRLTQTENTKLTLRETEIARLVAEGLTNRAISEKLNISIRTVNIHRTNMMRKIDAHNASDVTLFAVEQGLIPTA